VSADGVDVETKFGKLEVGREWKGEGVIRGKELEMGRMKRG
jgi:hypothetical protein